MTIFESIRLIFQTLKEVSSDNKKEKSEFNRMRHERYYQHTIQYKIEESISNILKEMESSESPIDFCVISISPEAIQMAIPVIEAQPCTVEWIPLEDPLQSTIPLSPDDSQRAFLFKLRRKAVGF